MSKLIIMKEKIQRFREYLDYIEEHYDNVQKAWDLIQEKCSNDDFRFISDDFVYNLINDDVINHDLSKLSKEEFTQYRKYFYPCSYELESVEAKKKIYEEMMKSWTHHKLNNQHHSECWTEEQLNNPYSDALVVMLVVDLVAMSFKFGGTAKEYYDSHKDEIIVTKNSEKLMYQIFKYIY